MNNMAPGVVQRGDLSHAYGKAVEREEKYVEGGRHEVSEQ